jgi:hypothetical protein
LNTFLINVPGVYGALQNWKCWSCFQKPGVQPVNTSGGGQLTVSVALAVTVAWFVAEAEAVLL